MKRSCPEDAVRPLVRGHLGSWRQRSVGIEKPQPTGGSSSVSVGWWPDQLAILHALDTIAFGHSQPYPLPHRPLTMLYPTLCRVCRPKGLVAAFRMHDTPIVPLVHGERRKVHAAGPSAIRNQPLKRSSGDPITFFTIFTTVLSFPNIPNAI